MSEFLSLIGDRVKAIRKDKGLTQEELAEKAELQYSYIGGIERGERNISLLSFQKVLDALEVSPLGFFSYNKVSILHQELNKTQLLSKHTELITTLNEEQIVIVNQITQKMLEFAESSDK